jgi:dynein heavy chain, axonemal
VGKQDPETSEVPDYEDKLNSNKVLGPFIRLCLIRALREDRTLLASGAFIQQVLGDKKYTAPINDTIQDIYEESSPTRPVLYLLQAGADPTQMIDDFAFKRKRPNINKVSMGEA